MHKKMTITLDESVYKALYLHVGRGKMSQFIENAVTKELSLESIEDQYKLMAADQARIAEFAEWEAGLNSDEVASWEW